MHEDLAGYLTREVDAHGLVLLEHAHPVHGVLVVSWWLLYFVLIK